MKTLKNKLLIGAMATLGFFGNADAQDSNKTKYEKIDRDKDGFPEEIIWTKEEFGKEFWHISWGKLQAYSSASVYYWDTDNDGFHEFIRTFDRSYYSSVTIFDFHIDRNTGLISYQRKAYSCSVRKWDKNFTGKSFYEIVKKNYDNSLPVLSKKNYANLTKQDLDDISPGFGMKIGNLINAWKSEESLKKLYSQDQEQ